MPKLNRLSQEGIKQLNTEIQINLTATSGVIIASVENINTLSHLSVCVLNCLLGGSRRSIPAKVFNGKTSFRDLTPPPPHIQIVNFILES